MWTRLIGYAVLSLTMLGCAGGQGERVRDAHMAGIDARADKKSDALGSQAASQQDVIDNRYDNSAEQIDNANMPGEDAQQTLAAVSRERAQYQSQARARLDQLAVRINAAQKKIEVLGSRAPTPLRTELETTADQFKQLSTQVTHLGDVAPSDWGTMTQQIDGRTDTLDSRVNRLSDSIDDV